MYKPVDALAVAAHPDDAELGCGGTLLRLRALGKQTAVLDLTRGELGSRGSVEIRRREAAEASRILGLEFRENLGLEDGNIVCNQENRLQLVRVLRACRPRLIVTHSRGGHPDHAQAATLVEEAVHDAGLVRIDSGQERFRPEKIAYWVFYSQNIVPDIVVDISDFYEQKEQAVRAFASQLYNPASRDPEIYLSRPDFLDQVRSFHRHLGNLSGCRYAEGFLLSRLPRIDDLLNQA